QDVADVATNRDKAFRTNRTTQRVRTSLLLLERGSEVRNLNVSVQCAATGAYDSASTTASYSDARQPPAVAIFISERLTRHITRRKSEAQPDHRVLRMNRSVATANGERRFDVCLARRDVSASHRREERD